MSDTAPPIDPYDPLPGLLATEARLLTQLARVRRAIAALDPARDDTAVDGGPSSVNMVLTTAQPYPSCPEEFRGLSILQASLRELATIKSPSKTKDIAKSLKERGFPAATDDLERNIAAAFRDHSKKYSELIRAADGTWALRDWYSHDDLEAILASQDSFKRSDRTKEGIEVARMTRGVRVGRERIATPEKMERVKELLKSGMSVQKAAKEVGLAPSTIYRDLPGGAAALRDGDGADIPRSPVR